MVTTWADRNVFVTGATGLLGSWLVEDLLEKQANVVCLLRDYVPRCRLIDQGLDRRVIGVRGDLSDPQLLTRVLNEYEIDTVFHLAAQTIVGTAVRSPLSTFESNIRGTWNLLDACRELRRTVRCVVVASSDKAYGAHPQLPYSEETPLIGRAPYDVSKSCADLIARSFFETYDVPLVITRCANLFGGGDLNFNRLIPGAIRAALTGNRFVIRSDGTLVRDFLYVQDAVRAYTLAAEWIEEPGIAGQAFNFGLDQPMSVLDVVRRVYGCLGQREIDPTILGEAHHEIPAQYMDCSKARQTLGWRPGFSFEDGLRVTIDWYRTWLDRASQRHDAKGQEILES
jgi:CDP-glucose 4,6-dehydratase